MTPEQLIKEADRCVKCGLCLPHCPTYLVLENEADSPRGRISLIQALANGQLNADNSLETHLSRCLSCRACESACPSGVRYGELIDGGRRLIAQSQRGNRVWRKILDLLSEPKRLGRWISLHNFARKTGLVHLIKTISTKRLGRLLALGRHLPEKATLLSDLYASKQPSGRLVQLFTGCVGSQTEQLLVKQAITILTRLGYAVEIPKAQTCCGALHRHNGYPDEADRLVELNRQQLEKSRAACLITLATACHLELDEHLQSDIPVKDLTSFLLELPQKSQPKLHPLEKRAAIHIPCSSRNDRSRELLQQIPSLEIIDLADNGTCCGAAGSYLLTQATLSETLGNRKLEALEDSQADILITSNTGCAMQFRQLISDNDLQMEVMHPAELYAQQLDTGA